MVRFSHSPPFHPLIHQVCNSFGSCCQVSEMKELKSALRSALFKLKVKSGETQKHTGSDSD